MRATQQHQATHLFVLMAALLASSLLLLILIIVPLCSIIRTDDVDESSRRLSIFNIPSQYDDPKSIADKIILPGEATPTYMDLINSASPLPKYSLDKVVALSKIYSSRFSILRYDPGTDRFVGYYSSEHKWVSGCTKLAEAFRILTILLRNLFPERFTSDSPELVLAVSGGDYPAVDTSSYGACISNNGERPCDNLLLEYAPILHFGSVFRNALFPNMIAMPMPRSHTDCFVNWLMHDRKRCDLFLPVESDATWDELIPQLVWRGTDFRYLAFQNNLERPTYERYIEGRTNPNTNQKMAATTILRENFAKLVPRWKTVVYTAESEIKAARSNTLPQVNCKFSSVPYGGKHAAIGAPEYKKWEEIDFPVAGEGMDEGQLSKFKYHIDTGGGGGTTWTGTVRKLGMPGLLFHHITPTRDYIHDQIQPWVHYVPVREDLEDLIEKLEWAETHQDEARRISENATELMKRLSTSEGFEPLFTQHMMNPLLEVIEAYEPLNLRDEVSWNDAFEQMGGGAFSLFIECTREHGCRVNKPTGSWYKGGKDQK